MGTESVVQAAWVGSVVTKRRGYICSQPRGVAGQPYSESNDGNSYVTHPFVACMCASVVLHCLLLIGPLFGLLSLLKSFRIRAHTRLSICTGTATRDETIMEAWREMMVSSFCYTPQVQRPLKRRRGKGVPVQALREVQVERCFFQQQEQVHCDLQAMSGMKT